MVSKDTRGVDTMGLHMRPANNFITAMTKYKSGITIVFNGNKINGKSIMNIMAACIKYDSPITIICDGEDEQAMIDEAVSLIENGLE